MACNNWIYMHVNTIMGHLPTHKSARAQAAAVVAYATISQQHTRKSHIYPAHWRHLVVKQDGKTQVKLCRHTMTHIDITVVA